MCIFLHSYPPLNPPRFNRLAAGTDLLRWDCASYSKWNNNDCQFHGGALARCRRDSSCHIHCGSSFYRYGLHGSRIVQPDGTSTSTSHFEACVGVFRPSLGCCHYGIGVETPTTLSLHPFHAQFRNPNLAIDFPEKGGCAQECRFATSSPATKASKGSIGGCAWFHAPDFLFHRT